MPKIIHAKPELIAELKKIKSILYINKNKVQLTLKDGRKCFFIQDSKGKRLEFPEVKKEGEK